MPKVSKAVEERMAAKEKAQKARKANTFLRKGRLTPEQEEEVNLCGKQSVHSRSTNVLVLAFQQVVVAGI